MTDNDLPATWEGDIPDKCDLCGEAIEAAFVDGRTTLHGGSHWACMCLGCHAEVGDGLGMGHGQKYERRGEEFIRAED